MNTNTQIQWPIATAWPELGGNAVHVWAAEFGAWQTSTAALFELLSPDERKRVESFRHEARRNSAIITRSLLRKLLGAYRDTDPRSIQFSYGAHGKPLLDPAEKFYFNTSHSHWLVMFAFTRAGEIGVDIEPIRTAMPRQMEIAEKFFSANELNQLRAEPDAERAEAFFRCWTRKEAFLKARGDGVFGGLNTFEVSLGKDDARVLRVGGDANPQHGWMASLTGIDGHAGAVFVRATECRISCWRVSPEFLCDKK